MMTSRPIALIATAALLADLIVSSTAATDPLPIKCNNTVQGPSECTWTRNGHGTTVHLAGGGLAGWFRNATDEEAPPSDCTIRRITGQGPNHDLTLIDDPRANRTTPHWWGPEALKGPQRSSPRFVALALQYVYLGQYAVVHSWIDAFNNYKVCSINFAGTEAADAAAHSTCNC